MNTTMEKNQIEFTKIKHDINGNPRYVCHFFALLNEGDDIKSNTKGLDSVSVKYRLAVNKAHKIGGSKFHNKQYGGGIVFQDYSTDSLQETIESIKEVNTDFLKEWTPKQFKQVERAIYNHFSVYTYKWQPTHEENSRKQFHPFDFNSVDELLGLAYTSTGAYAGYWVCNGGYMMANKTHHFTGFAINIKGHVIGIVSDENENEIFIEL